MKCCFIADMFYYGDYDYYDNKKLMEKLFKTIKKNNVDELVLTDSNEFEYNVEMYFEHYSKYEYEQHFNFKLTKLKAHCENNINFLLHCFNLINDCDFCVILKKKHSKKNSFNVENICLNYLKNLKKQYLIVH